MSNESELKDKLLADDRLIDIESIAYVLATVKHETANTFLPIEEHGPDHYFNRYDLPNRVAVRLGNTEIGDGLRYKGRGYCQITGKALYKKFGELLNIDLLNNPELALDPKFSYDIMIIGMTKGLFTGVSLWTYINDENVDFVRCRRIINGTDKDVLIADYAEKYLEELEK